MKKILHILLLILLLCSFTSCSSSHDEIPQDPDSDNGVSKTEFLIFQNEIKLYGNIYTPLDFDESMSYPLIIMSHSANVNSDTLNSYATRSALLGYIAYTFDFPSACNDSRSDDIALCTIFTEIDTLSFLVNYFSEVNYVNKIYLFGTSQGGLVSSVVADEMESLIDGLILFYPAYNIPEMIVSFPYFTDKDYVEQLKEYNVYDHIGKFQKDVLIEHGTKDIMVPYSYSERADELYVNSTLILIDGANHGFNKENHYMNDNYDEETWSYVADYLTSHLEIAD